MGVYFGCVESHEVLWVEGNLEQQQAIKHLQGATVGHHGLEVRTKANTAADLVLRKDRSSRRGR